MTSRDRILARRARFVAAAVAVAGCREAEPPRPPVATAPMTPPEATSALAGPPRDAGTDSGPLDSDHDGIPDEDDKCPYVAGVVAKEGCPAPCLMIIAPTKLEIRARIYFANNSSTVAKESAAILDDIAAALKQNALDVEVQGHGDLGESKTIGAARAKAVRDELIKRGVDGARLTERDLGTSQPLKNGPYAPNRRVELEVK